MTEGLQSRLVGPGVLRTLLIGVLIGSALLLSAVRLASPWLDDNRDRVSALLSDRFGISISLGSLRARWHGLTPVVEARQVRIGDPSQPLFIQRIRLSLAPGRLLIGSPWDAMELHAEGMALTLIRREDGRIVLQGIGPLDADQTLAQPSLALPRRMHLADTRILWIDQLAGKAPMSLDSLKVSVDRHAQRLDLHASLAGATGKASLSARIQGSLGSTSWHGASYLRADNLAVAELFAAYLPPHYRLHRLHSDLELWSRWEDARPVHVRGRVGLSDLEMSAATLASERLSVTQVSAEVDAHRHDDGWQIGLHEVHLQVDGSPWPVGDTVLRLHRAAETTRIDLAADFLRLQDVLTILGIRPPWPDLAQTLDRHDPQGDLHGLRLQIEMTPQATDWRATARLRQGSIDAFGGIPGIRNLDASLHAQQGHIRLALDGRSVSLDLGSLFREALQFTSLNGTLDLVSTDRGWQLYGSELLADSPHIRTRSRLDMHLGPGRMPFIDLQTDFRDGDAAHAHRYLPVGIMAKPLVEWLDRSIVSGRIVAGTALIHGPLQDFAFDDSRSGNFEVLFTADDLQLDYHPGWPVLQKVAAEVHFHGKQLDIQIHDAEIGGNHLTQAKARIASLDPLSPLLIEGRVSGPLQGQLATLQSPALRDRFGHLVSGIEVGGDSDLHLTMQIALASRHETSLLGRLLLDANSLTLPAWDLTLDHLAGEIQFDLDGVRARQIRGRSQGSAVRLDVLPQTNGNTRIRTQGRFDMGQAVARWTGLPPGLAEGSADLTLDIEMPTRPDQPNADPLTLRLSSKLEGTTLRLPAPFGKDAAAIRELALRLPLGRTDQIAELRYADLLEASFSLDGERVDVGLGQAATQRPGPGIRIVGDLSELDIAGWRTLLATLPEAASVATSVPTSLQLNIARLPALDIRDLRLEAQLTEGTWRGSVAGQALQGDFQITPPVLDRPLLITLQGLEVRLPLEQTADLVAAPPDPTQGPSPTAFPGMQLRIDGLQVNDAQLGDLIVDTRPGVDGLYLSRLQLDGESLQIRASGGWLSGATGIGTRLGGEAETPALGDLLVALGYSRQFEDAAAKSRFELAWPGNPMQSHRATLQGRVHLDLAPGRLVELDPGVTRIVGVLNLNALTRRLRLDFSDFYKKGYSFDSIQGAFDLADGLAATRQLRIVGPSGSIDLVGVADLQARTLDQKVSVIPSLDATLPIASAIAGGPVAGVAVFLAQQVVSDQVEDLYRFDYQISGPWVDPEVKPLDSGGGLSKLLRPLRRREAAAAPAENQDPAPRAGLPESAGSAAQPSPPPDLPSDPGDGLGNADSPAAGPLQGVMRLLRKGEPHGADLPGSGN